MMLASCFPLHCTAQLALHNPAVHQHPASAYGQIRRDHLDKWKADACDLRHWRAETGMPAAET